MAHKHDEKKCDCQSCNNDWPWWKPQSFKELLLGVFGTLLVIIGIVLLINDMTHEAHAYEEPEHERVVVPLEYDNMLSPSGVTEEELEYALRYDLRPLASTFLEAEEKYGVNAVYLAAISALESGWGRYQFEENNIFGFGNKEFGSEEECIMYVAEFLKEHYLDEDGQYYGGGLELEHVNVSWNGGRHWLKVTTEIVETLTDRIEEYRKENFFV